MYPGFYGLVQFEVSDALGRIEEKIFPKNAGDPLVELVASERLERMTFAKRCCGQ